MIVGGYSSHGRISRSELNILNIHTVFSLKSRDISLLLRWKSIDLENVVSVPSRVIQRYPLPRGNVRRGVNIMVSGTRTVVGGWEK